MKHQARRRIIEKDIVNEMGIKCLMSGQDQRRRPIIKLKIHPAINIIIHPVYRSIYCNLIPTKCHGLSGLCAVESSASEGSSQKAISIALDTSKIFACRSSLLHHLKLGSIFDLKKSLATCFCPRIEAAAKVSSFSSAVKGCRCSKNLTPIPNPSQDVK